MVVEWSPATLHPILEVHMRCSLAHYATLTICLATCVAVDAGDPKKLTQACPRLAPIDGAPAGTTVIDNLMVLRLAKKGRIAAVAPDRPPVPESHDLTPAAEAKIKKRWRAEHRRSVIAIHTLQEQLTQAEGEYEALESLLRSLDNVNE